MEVQLFSAYYKICIPCSYRCRVCISYLRVTVWRINEERMKTIANNNNSKVIYMYERKTTNHILY